MLQFQAFAAPSSVNIDKNRHFALSAIRSERNVGVFIYICAMDSPIRGGLPHVDTGPRLRPSLMVFERKTSKFGVFQLYGGLKPKSSSAVRLRKRGEQRAPSLSPVNTAREPKHEVHRSDTTGLHTARYLRPTLTPSLTLQGQRPPNIQREPRAACLSELRIRRTRASELPAETSSSDDDRTDTTVYESMYPRLRPEEGKDREIGTMRISIAMKSRAQGGIQCFAGLHSHSFVLFAVRGRAVSMDSSGPVVLTVQLAKPSAWIARICSANGAAVLPFDSNRDSALLLAPKGKPQHISCLSAKKYNHIPGCSLLFSPDRLHEAVKNSRSDLPFLLPAFNILTDMHAFMRYKAAHPKAMWISKGLDTRSPPQFLTSSLLASKEPRLLVKYMRSPHLYQQRKYHFGFFLLITSLSPLVLYIANEGFVYLAKEKFTLSSDDPAVHFLENKDRRPLSDLRIWLNDALGGISGVLTTASDIAIQLLLALQPRLTAQDHRYSPQTLRNCFEIVELDVMFDSQLRPWVLGCKPLAWKAAASLSREVLEPLLCQALNIVGVEAGNRERGSLGSIEQRAVRQLDEETARMHRSNSTLWERIFPTRTALSRSPTPIRDSSALNLYLCERDASG